MIECDVNWRDANDDQSYRLFENREREILVETDVTMRLAKAKNIDPFNQYINIFRETAIRYAYID
jgi:hypothetical protein